MTSLFRLGFLYDPGISHFPHQTSPNAHANTTLLSRPSPHRPPRRYLLGLCILRSWLQKKTARYIYLERISRVSREKCNYLRRSAIYCSSPPIQTYFFRTTRSVSVP
ncbi:hypothetical protein MATL_G00242710 [Megalops atlanticus]|uniref:Uncharacterized protein n=1 Tax=Megalops atlanticus TaxID=7932 RepID=A0A9D3PCQ4_MEGAT|nr:hypothetical protein MATL_G00242710 [Megalops atlanticus]